MRCICKTLGVPAASTVVAGCLIQTSRRQTYHCWLNTDSKASTVREARSVRLSALPGDLLTSGLHGYASTSQTSAMADHCNSSAKDKPVRAIVCLGTIMKVESMYSRNRRFGLQLDKPLQALLAEEALFVFGVTLYHHEKHRVE
jgi:hypothetical protein